MIIGFDAGELNERGTGVALYDYAYYCRTILGYESIIFYTGTTSEPVLDRFKKHFEAVSYDTLGQLQRATEEKKIDVSYFLKAGNNDGKLSRSSKNAVHAVFRQFGPHGDVYAFVSKWLADAETNGIYPYVPHIVELPQPQSDLRKELNIPREAFVIGRHGAYNTFNLEFAQKAVIRALERRKNLYFVFVNTPPFCRHERVFFLPAVVDTVKKSDFINACDAMLHARTRGESFGLAIAEFMFFDKPVICWAGGGDRNHLQMLPDERLVYRRYSDLLGILTSLESGSANGQWRRIAEEFSPANVMRQFKEVFIDGAAQNHTARPSLQFVLKNRITQRALKARYDLWRHGLGV